MFRRAPSWRKRFRPRDPHGGGMLSASAETLPAGFRVATLGPLQPPAAPSKKILPEGEGPAARARSCVGPWAAGQGGAGARCGGGGLPADWGRAALTGQGVGATNPPFCVLPGRDRPQPGWRGRRDWRPPRFGPTPADPASRPGPDGGLPVARGKCAGPPRAPAPCRGLAPPLQPCSRPPRLS